DLGQLVVRGGEADLQALGFAGPAFPPGLADAGGQVVADFFQPRALGRVISEERAPDTAVFMDAAGAVCAPAVTEGEPAALEVAEEFFPFGIGRGTVFFAGAQFAAAGDERPVAVDGLFRIDRFIAHCRIYILVS